jgi:hypothetical protein
VSRLGLALCVSLLISSLVACGPSEPETVVETVVHTRVAEVEVPVTVEVEVTRVVEVTREVKVDITREVEVTRLVERIVTATPTPTPVFSLTDENLALGLITLEDLPSGWTGGLSEEQTEDGDTYQFICTELERRASQRAAAEFEQGQLGPFLNHYVALYPRGLAERALADMVGAVELCAEWTQTTDDGTVYKWEISPMAFPTLGDETLAIRVSTADIPLLGLFQLDQVYVRYGDVIFGITYGEIGLEGVDSEQTEFFVQLAMEKLRTLSQD